MPRETAPAHRHAAFAVRFIIEGQGGFTAVQGQRVVMNPRDVIITPVWNWHDHGKKGADEEGGDENPVIWLDGLDLPEFVHFPVHFNEHYYASRYPAIDVPVEQSEIVFPWSKMQSRLDRQPGAWVNAAYLKASGEECMFLSFHRLSIFTSLFVYFHIYPRFADVPCCSEPYYWCFR